MRLFKRKYRIFVEHYSNGELRFYPQRKGILLGISFGWWNYTTGDEYFDWDVYFSTEEEAQEYIGEQKLVDEKPDTHIINL